MGGAWLIFVKVWGGGVSPRVGSFIDSGCFLSCATSDRPQYFNGNDSCMWMAVPFLRHYRRVSYGMIAAHTQYKPETLDAERCNRSFA